MHFRRFAALLLGAWLAGSLFMDMVATGNFRSVDRLLAAPSPPAAERIQAIGGHDMARAFLRYQVSEQNRWYFDTWERIQIGLGATLFVVLLLSPIRDNVLLVQTLLLLAIVLVMHFFLTPQIVRLGRAIDFTPPGTPSGDRTTFWTFHGVYSGGELMKLGLGLLMAVWLVRRRKGLQPAQAESVGHLDPSAVSQN
jgi:hypothetical protein